MTRAPRGAVRCPRRDGIWERLGGVRASCTGESIFLTLHRPSTSQILDYTPARPHDVAPRPEAGSGGGRGEAAGGAEAHSASVGLPRVRDLRPRAAVEAVLAVALAKRLFARKFDDARGGGVRGPETLTPAPAVVAHAVVLQVTPRLQRGAGAWWGACGCGAAGLGVEAVAAGRAVEAGGLTLQVAVPFRGTWQMKPSASHSTIVLPHTLPDPSSSSSASWYSFSVPFW